MRPAPAAWLAAALAAPGTAAAADVSHQLFLGASFVIGFGDGVHPGVGLQVSEELLVGYDPGVVAGAWLEGRWVSKRGLSLDVGARAGLAIAETYSCGGLWRPVAGFSVDPAAHFGRGGPALRLGATFSGLSALTGGFSVNTRGDGWAQPSVHVGARGFLPAMCIVGRPLWDGEGRVMAAAAGPTAAAARVWLDRGREEHEAVGAFVRLAAELRALGAPPALIAAAKRAATEEIGHALASYALAAALGDHPVTFGPLRLPTRGIDDRGAAIARLAVEGLLDGVVGEGTAAARSEDGAGRGTPRERAIEEKIAIEERTHAAIGDRTIGWALREAPRQVRAALAAIAA